MKTTIVLLAILSVSMAGGIGSLYSVMEPQSNWMNPVSGSWIEFYLMSDIETSSAASINLLIGLPFTTTDLNVDIMVVEDSCVWQGDSYSGSVWSAEEDVRDKHEGLNYYYVSTGAAYKQGSIIAVKLIMDLPSGATGWTRPLHVALISTSEPDYQVWAENSNIAPLYILEAAKEGMIVTDRTTDSKKASMSSSISVLTEIVPTLPYRRIKMAITGYTIDSSSVFTLSSVSASLVETNIDSSEYVVMRISNWEVDILFHNVSEWREAGTVYIYWTAKSPDMPSGSTLNVKTMDLFGPNVIEMGSASSFLSCSTVGWSTGYPKVRFSYGLDAASSSTLKDSYGLYTVGGTSLVYNTLTFELKTGATLPSGSQSLSIVIGSTTVPAYPALNTLTHTFAALTGEEVECEVSSIYITCDGIDLKGKSGIVSLKVAYTKSGTQISDFAKAVLKVDGTTIVTGTPSLKSGFSTPIGNRSPVSPSKWSTYISSAFGSRYIEDVDDLNGDNIRENLPLSDDSNGIYVGDGQIFYFWSRIGPYDYYSTSLNVLAGADPKKMFVELTVPQDISASYQDNSADNMIAYLDEADLLNTELDQDFYWESSSSTSGWLKYAVERPLCDEDLNDSNDMVDRLARSCVEWFCYTDIDGDGSYDSPQPCKPVRACDSDETTYLWYPKADRIDRHHNLLRVPSAILAAETVDYTELSDLSVLGYNDHVDSEICRPVLECDTTDAANGEARHWNKHSSGNDCRRSELPLCTEETNEGSGILDDYSDSSVDCEEVQACDLDTDGDGNLDSAIDGEYCNPIDINTDSTLIYQQCDELPNPNSELTHSTTHSTLGECVQQPLCTVKSLDSVDGLDELHVDGDCVAIDDDNDLCTYYLSDSADDLQKAAGLTMLSYQDQSTDCWYVPVCDKAPEESSAMEWVTEDRIDGRYCSLDLPICNWGTPYDVHYNKAIFLEYRNDLDTFYTTTGTIVNQISDGAASADGFGDCYSLDACDTFDDNSILREHSEQHACVKLAMDNSYDDSYVDSNFQAIQCYRHWRSIDQNVLESIVSIGGTNADYDTVFYKQNDGECVKIHTCNAVNDDGVAVYVDRYGYETDCFTNGDIDTTADTERIYGHYGMIVLSDATNVPSDALPQATCQWRSTIKGDLDTMPWGWDCVEMDSDLLCDDILNAGDTIYESLNGDSDCQYTTDCEYNAWIQNSKYALHILADMDGDIYYETYTNMEQWYTYWNSPSFMSQYCLPVYDSTGIDYIAPDGAMTSTIISYSRDTYLNERRRNLANDADYYDDDHSENYIHVPGTFLFVEDIVYDIDDDGNYIYVSETNPINAVRYEAGGDGYNIFKFQAAQITADYVTAPRAHEREYDTFTVQTWNLLFFTPLDGTTESGHNVFAFKDTSITASAANSLTTLTATDVHLLDLYWAVYFNAATTDITVSLTTSPSLKGMENLVIYTDMEDSDPDSVAYFGEDGIYWTTYSYYGVDRYDDSLNNFFVIYGEDFGDDTDLALASTMTIFFASIEGIPMDSSDDVEGDQDIDCSSMGIDVTACRYVTENYNGLSSSSVTYIGDPDASDQSKTIYNPLYWGRIEIDIVAGSDQSSWSVVFPFDGDSETSQIYPLIGLQDASERLLYLSGVPNNNYFGPGAARSSSGNYVYGGTLRSSSIVTYATELQVQNLYLESGSRPSVGAWLDFDSDWEVCEVVTSSTLNIIGDTYLRATDTYGGWAGVAICAPYDYTEEEFSLSYTTDYYTQYDEYPNWFGCWDTLVVYDDYCTLCNIDNWYSGTTSSPLTISVSNFVLPDYYGTSLPANLNTIIYDQRGVMYEIIDLNDAGSLYDTGIVTIVADGSVNKGYENTKTTFSLSTPCRIPASSSILLVAVTGDDSINYISTPSGSSNPCYIVQGSETSDCSFSWSSSSVSISVYEELDSTPFVVHLYGLYAEDSVDNTATGINWDIYISNSAGRTLYENDWEDDLLLSYSTASYTVTVDDVKYLVDNYGWNSALMMSVSTTKSFYENDYIYVGISDFTPGNEESLECTIWADDMSYDAGNLICEVTSTNDGLWIYPAVNSNGAITALSVHIMLSNVVALSNKSKVQAIIYYGNEILAKESSLVNVPSTYTTPYSLNDLAVSVSYEYIGVPSNMVITFTAAETIAKEDVILVGLSNDYSYTKHDMGMIWATVNGAEAYISPYATNMLMIWGTFSAKVNAAVNVTIWGLSPPNMASTDSRIVYVGVINDTSSSDWAYNSPHHLSQMGTVKVTSLPSTLELVDLIYPRFETVLKSTTRRESSYFWFWDIEELESYAAGSTVKISLKSTMWASYGMVGSVSCSLKLVSSKSTANVADKCTFLRNQVSFNLKSAITQGTYFLQLDNLPNPDWEMCGANIAEVQVWSAGTLLAMSAPAITDSMMIDISKAPYSLEYVDVPHWGAHLMLPVGFYTELEITTSTGYYSEVVSDLSINGGAGNLQLESHSSHIGGTSQLIHLGVNEGEIEAMYPLSLKAVLTEYGKGNKYDDSRIWRLPVVGYHTVVVQDSIQANLGSDIKVELGSTTWPICVCGNMHPVNPHSFKVSIASTSEDSSLDPKLTVDKNSFELSMEKICDWIIVSANSTSAKVDMTSVLSIVGDELYQEYGTTVTVVAASKVNATIKVSDVTVNAYSASMVISCNAKGLVVVYAAPTVMYMSDADSEDFYSAMSGEEMINHHIILTHFIYDEAEVVVSMDGLLRNIPYNYTIGQIISGNVTVPSIKGGFTTLWEGSDEYKATVLNISLVGTYDEDTVQEYACDLSRYFSIPVDDVSTIYGVNCGKVWMDEEKDMMEEEEEAVEEEKTNSKKSTRILQSDEEAEEEEEEVDTTVVTLVEVLLLPPLMQDTNAVVIDTTSLAADLTEFWEIEVRSVEMTVTDEIQEASYTEVKESKANTNSFQLTISGVYNEKAELIQGVVCWAVYSGNADKDYQSILSGDKAEDYSCDYYVDDKATAAQDFKVEGLKEGTTYTVLYFATGLDTREVSTPTEIESLQVTTSRRSIDEGDTEEEEEDVFGYLTSFGFIALLLAFIFNL